MKYKHVKQQQYEAFRDSHDSITTGMVAMCNLASLSLWRFMAIKFRVIFWKQHKQLGTLYCSGSIRRAAGVEVPAGSLLGVGSPPLLSPTAGLGTLRQGTRPQHQVITRFCQFVCCPQSPFTILALTAAAKQNFTTPNYKLTLNTSSIFVLRKLLIF